MNIRRFRALHAAGATFAEIGRECGCDWSTVRRYLAEDAPSAPPEGPPRAGSQPLLITPFVPLVEAWLRADPTLKATVGDPDDQAHDDGAIRPGATRAALGAATGVRPEPLTRPPDAERRRDVSAGSVAETHSDIYQGTLCSALVLAALRAAPRPSRPTDRHQTRTEVETPGRPARPTRRPQISSDQDQLQEERNRHPLGAPSARARLFPAGCPPRSSMTAAKPIPTDRFHAERLAARVDRSSGCRFHPVAEQARRSGMLLCSSQCASSDRCELDPRRSQRSNNGVADCCQLSLPYHSRCWWPDEHDAALGTAVDIRK
jgi:hypothetical protein